MEADEVYSELGDKISDLTSKDSEFQGTIDYLQSSITDLKNAVEAMKTDLEFVKTFVQNTQEANDAAAQKQKYDDIIAQVQKIASDAAAAQKAADANAGFVTKLGGQMDDITKTFTSTDTLKTIVSNAVDAGKKEVLSIWDTGKKDITNSLSDYVTKQISDVKTEMWTGIKSFFGDEEAAKPKPVLQEELEPKVRDIIATVQSEKSPEDFEQKVRDIITKVQAEQKA